MKKRYVVSGLVLLALLAGVLFIFAFPTQVAFPTQAKVGTLQIYKGDASVRDGKKEIVGMTGTPLHLHDKVVVAKNSTVAIVLNDGSVLRLEQGTEVEIAELSYEGNTLKQASFNLTVGRLWSRVKPLSKESQFEVETPAITAAIRGTSFNVTNKDDITGVYVHKHTVEVTLSNGTKEQAVTDGQLLRMNKATWMEDYDKGPKPIEKEDIDDWITFNIEEDKKLCERLHDLPECTEPSTSITPTPSPTYIPTPTIKIYLKPSATPTQTPTPTRPASTPTYTPTPTTRQTSSAPTSTATPTPTQAIIIFFVPTRTPTPTPIIIY